jgi:hypothetical protein
MFGASIYSYFCVIEDMPLFFYCVNGDADRNRRVNYQVPYETVLNLRIFLVRIASLFTLQ